jgi:hypothetical protein
VEDAPSRTKTAVLLAASLMVVAESAVSRVVVASMAVASRWCREHPDGATEEEEHTTTIIITKNKFKNANYVKLLLIY